MENNLENNPLDLAEQMQQEFIQEQEKMTLETRLENGIETDFEIEVETAQKLQETAFTGSTGTKTDFDREQKLDRNNLETDAETETETAENNSDTAFHLDDSMDNDPIPETQEDPLNEYVQETPKTNPVEEIKKATGESTKNLKNLAELGEIAFTYIDLAKAQLCSSISGQHVAEYTADEKAKKVLISAVQEYLSTQEIKAPTPLMTLLLAVGTWAAAGFGAAFWHKYQLKQMKPSPAPSAAAITQEESLEDEEQEQAAGEPTSDFSHLKEYQDGRKLFEIHKTKGTYKRLPNNTYCAIEIAHEIPSPEIQTLIDQGKTNPEIRAIIYGE
ncbi:hypothetical protein [Aureispira anguillae]|uniref:Uncharacterized protein n=1 Tax=Aureispira anguillae TaxID=2864201 RepID=A0A915YG50_9BACT|nr:hypothetical protein [Aureispira anguillae]BDS12376.1 hypothetical protein AsAng_0030970 [Aureispira anguillae]